jgi:hypothetical protein
MVKDKDEKINCAANDILMDEDEENIDDKTPNTFQDAVKELGSIAFKKYPKQTSNLSYENINGIIRAEVLNDYMETNFGYRYSAIDKLVQQKQLMVTSKSGWGMDKIIEFVKSIQASFEQTQLPARMRDMLGK